MRFALSRQALPEGCLTNLSTGSPEADPCTAATYTFEEMETLKLTGVLGVSLSFSLLTGF